MEKYDIIRAADIKALQSSVARSSWNTLPTRWAASASAEFFTVIPNANSNTVIDVIPCKIQGSNYIIILISYNFSTYQHGVVSVFNTETGAIHDAMLPMNPDSDAATLTYVPCCACFVEDSNTLIVGTDSGDIMRAVLTSVENPGYTLSFTIIRPAHFSEGVCALSCGGSAVVAACEDGALAYSSDSGQTWARSSGAYGLSVVRAITYVPEKDKFLFVDRVTGYVSTDHGATWSSYRFMETTPPDPAAVVAIKAFTSADVCVLVYENGLIIRIVNWLDSMLNPSVGYVTQLSTPTEGQALASASFSQSLSPLNISPIYEYLLLVSGKFTKDEKKYGFIYSTDLGESWDVVPTLQVPGLSDPAQPNYSFIASSPFLQFDPYLKCFIGGSPSAILWSFF